MKRLKHFKCFLLSCAVIGAILAMGAGAPILPYMTQYWRSVLDDDTPVHQPIAGNSTTFFQIKNAAGTVIVLTVDTTNEEVEFDGDTILLSGKEHQSSGNEMIFSGNSGSRRLLRMLNWSAAWSDNKWTGFFQLGHNLGDGNLGMFTGHNGATFNRFAIVSVGTVISSEGASAVTPPDYFFELRSATPDFAMRNSTHENSDGGRESQILFRGEKGDSTIHTLVKEVVSHDTAADDYAGKWVLSTHTAAIGGGVDSVTDVIKVDSTQTTYIGDAGVTNYVNIDATGVLGLNGLAGLQLPHMMQSDSTNQTVGTANVAQVITFNTDVHHFGITRTTSSRFTILKEASYLIAISVVCDTDPGQSKDIEIWLRINGSDVANSNTILHLVADNEDILAVTFINHFNVNDYFEFWMTGEGNDVRILATPAVTTGGEERPACPSIIMTCNYVGVD